MCSSKSIHVSLCPRSMLCSIRVPCCAVSAFHAVQCPRSMLCSVRVPCCAVSAFHAVQCLCSMLCSVCVLCLQGQAGRYSQDRSERIHFHWWNEDMEPGRYVIMMSSAVMSYDMYVYPQCLKNPSDCDGMADVMRPLTPAFLEAQHSMVVGWKTLLMVANSNQVAMPSSLRYVSCHCSLSRPRPPGLPSLTLKPSQTSSQTYWQPSSRSWLHPYPW